VQRHSSKAVSAKEDKGDYDASDRVTTRRDPRREATFLVEEMANGSDRRRKDDRCPNTASNGYSQDNLPVMGAEPDTDHHSHDQYRPQKHQEPRAHSVEHWPDLDPTEESQEGEKTKDPARFIRPVLSQLMGFEVCLESAS